MNNIIKNIRLGMIILILFWTKQGEAQWECRSHLSANLKPIGSSDLKWALELVGTTGYLTNSSIYSGMAFLAVDYSVGNHQFYAEGGYKYWMQNDMDAGYYFDNGLLGLRELSYSFYTPKIELNIGLHQMGLQDYILVNERAWGTSFSTSLNGYDLEFDLATVTKDFSRNGTFCTNCFLYNLVPTRNYPLGNSFGETNFAALSFSKNIGTKSASDNLGDDEFESFDSGDEFGSFSEIKTSPKSGLKMDSYGAVLYSEFGTYYYQPQLYGGLFTTFKFGENTKLKAEGLYQYISDNNALIGYLQLNHNKIWNSGNSTDLSATFLGKVDIDDNALAMPRFSNLFFGEVFRMDAIDLPLMNVSLKHRFTKHQLSLKAQYSQQFVGTNMQEFDISAGKFFLKKRIRTTLIAGMMKNNELQDWANLARIELRVFF